MKNYLTVTETAKVLGVARRTVGYWVERKQKVGKYAKMKGDVYYIPKAKVLKYQSIMKDF